MSPAYDRIDMIVEKKLPREFISLQHRAKILPQSRSSKVAAGSGWPSMTTGTPFHGSPTQGWGARGSTVIFQNEQDQRLASVQNCACHQRSFVNLSSPAIDSSVQPVHLGSSVIQASANTVEST